MQILPTPCNYGTLHIATTFWLLMGYNFSFMTASGTLFDSRGWVFGDKLSNDDIAELEGVRDVAMAPNFGTALAANGL